MEATLRKTGALLGKDLKDVVKNPTMLVCCLLPVGFMLFYKNAVGGGMEGEAAEAFSSMLVSWSLLFTATMVASMATLNAIAEEKEKHTLRTLMLANVSAEQMLASRGLVTLLAIALVDAACYLVIGQPLAGLPAFLAIGVAGSVPIVLLSLLLGLVARDQMSAGVLSMPILVAGIAPMFAQMVDGLSDIAPYLPTGGMNELGMLLAQGELFSSDAIAPVATTLAWVAVAAVAFALLYRRLARDNSEAAPAALTAAGAPRRRGEPALPITRNGTTRPCPLGGTPTSRGGRRRRAGGRCRTPGSPRSRSSGCPPRRAGRAPPGSTAPACRTRPDRALRAIRCAGSPRPPRTCQQQASRPR